MLPEIHSLACGYDAQCTDLGECTERATVLARRMGHQGELLNQREVCERHAQWLKDWASFALGQYRCPSEPSVIPS